MLNQIYFYKEKLMNALEIRKIEIFHKMSRGKSNKVIDIFLENFNLLRNIDIVFVNKA